MAKVSPMVRSFNAGEFSILVEGRPDIDRYPASMRYMMNFIAAPQGPAIARSGTKFEQPAANQNEPCALLSFVFSELQSLLLEFSGDRIRFMNEDGIVVYPEQATNITSGANAAITMNSATLGANIGDEVVLMGFPFDYNLNGEIARVVAKAGNVYTLNKSYPNKPVVQGTVARVYHVPCVYSVAERAALRGVQSVDVVHLLTGVSRPRVLSRYGDYDWRLADFTPVDGPYMPVNETTTKLTPSARGSALPSLTGNTAPAGYTATGSGNRPAVNGTPSAPATLYGRNITYAATATQFFHAFDGDNDTYWASGAPQKGILEIQTPSAFVCDGYVIYSAKDNQDTSYLTKDFAPGSFTFEGYDGTNWVVLDTQETYLLYDNSRSVLFKVKNTVAYSRYRLNITECTRNGQIEPRVRELVLRSKASSTFTLTASSTTGINNDAGFKATDVGRLIRLRGSDGAWRSANITAFTSATAVTVELLDDPLPDLKPIQAFRLSYWSDTTGWPNCGDYFDDRLWLCGSTSAPDMFAGSVVGSYNNFSQTDLLGVVLDDNAIAARLNSRKLSRIQWIASDNRGVIFGTGSEEYVYAAPDNQALTARNGKAKSYTKRGSANVEPVQIDSQVLHVQRGGRSVREFSYIFENDGYKSPSMSQLAGHIGTSPFVEMKYAAEPHSIIWMRRTNGTVVGLTYNREENVVGWHRHDFSGAVIESIACLPQKDQLQDALWMQVKRTIDGQTKRYIERLMPFWDFNSTLDTAHYVDCGLRYEGDEITFVYGLQHLEGQQVYGLVDYKPFGPVTVQDGSIELPLAGSKIVVGLGYDCEGETSRLENGAQDGTAFGKVGRINYVTPMFWDSYGGFIGRWNREKKAPVYEPIEYPGNFAEYEEVALWSGELDAPINMAEGYEMRKTLWFKRPKESPLPFNIICLMPQLTTQDR